MSEGWKAGIDTITMTLEMEGELHFLSMATRHGLVKRRGSPRAGSGERTLVEGAREGVFEAVMQALPEGLPRHQGRRVADGEEGRRCHWHLELTGPGDPVVLDLIYYTGSAGLPPVIAEVVRTFESLTDEWYAEESAKPTHGVEPARGPDVPRSGEAEDLRPNASRRRRLLAVVIDFGLLSVPYAWLYFFLTPPEAGVAPLVEGLVVLGIIEVVLVQFVRWSPGYWALGISIPLGRPPTTDPDQKARESWVTLLVGFLMTAYGVEGMRDWILAPPLPAPYFGLPWALFPSIVISVALGVLGVVSGLLILHAKIRGVWWGAALVGLSLLSLVVGDRELWDIWTRASLEMSAQSRGRTMDPATAEALLGFTRTLLFAIPLLYAFGLGLAWRRLRTSPQVEAS